eukprot:630980-Amphidinium_carterae.1
MKKPSRPRRRAACALVITPALRISLMSPLISAARSLVLETLMNTESPTMTLKASSTPSNLKELSKGSLLLCLRLKRIPKTLSNPSTTKAADEQLCLASTSPKSSK